MASIIFVWELSGASLLSLFRVEKDNSFSEDISMRMFFPNTH